METRAHSAIDNEVSALREGIRTKYRAYQQIDPDRFPDLDFNTNRANYEPLRDSFEEEFYKVRGIDRKNPNIGVPSTNTLALIFTDDDYLPGKKILNTSRSYAGGATRFIAKPDMPAPTQRKLPAADKAKWMLAGAVSGVFGLGLLVIVGRWLLTPVPSGLVMERPTPHSTVWREVVVEGEVANAETVWPVVHSRAIQKCWVAHPIKVGKDGWWIGVIYVGSVDKADEGSEYEVRVFVNPTQPLTTGEVLSDWPEAELSTKPVAVVRGPNHN